MAITVHTFVSDVTGITIRDVAGDGSQVELLVNSRRYGLLSLRAIGLKGSTVRITDMRRRDKASERARGKQFVQGIPFQAVLDHDRKKRKSKRGKQ